jgi:hypothetical protein
MTVSGETLSSISTPERVDSRLGTLDFVDGFPSSATSELPSSPQRSLPPGMGPGGSHAGAATSQPSAADLRPR